MDPEPVVRVVRGNPVVRVVRGNPDVRVVRGNPDVRVVRGNPDDFELGALVCVLAAAAARPAPEPPVVNYWSAGLQLGLQARHPAPGMWRASALPGPG